MTAELSKMLGGGDGIPYRTGIEKASALVPLLFRFQNKDTSLSPSCLYQNTVNQTTLLWIRLMTSREASLLR